MSKLSPMMQQYLSIKEQYKDCILFFRLGDFYEMFFDDAEIGSKELELTLTGKNCGLEERAPMCGVPFHSANTYIRKLIEKDYKVAICEQVSDPSQKGIVDREVIRVITKGTIVDESILDEKSNNFICALNLSNNKLGISYCDVSTGEFFCYELNDYKSNIKNEINRIYPMEIIYNNEKLEEYIPKDILSSFLSKNLYTKSKIIKKLYDHFKVSSLLEFNIESEIALESSGFLLMYISETQKNNLSHITNLSLYNRKDYMILDKSTLDNLEIVNSIKYKNKKHSLLSIIDKTSTSMGSRLLKQWIEHPLVSKELIDYRLNKVKKLYDNPIALDTLKSYLSKCYDIERLLNKISYKSITPIDCLSILKTLNEIPNIKKCIENYKLNELYEIIDNLDQIPKLCDLIDAAIDQEASQNISDGGFIKSGYMQELDELRNASKLSKQWLIDLEIKEREITGIKNLRISYNKVFGYFIEVTNSYLNQVPLRYSRKQTLTGLERFTTEELKNIEDKILNSNQSAIKLEILLFDNLKNTLEALIPRIQKNVEIIKELDVYSSLAYVALENNYCMPIINNESYIKIINGRHPVVEIIQKDSEFISNDLIINSDDSRTHIITGPNMSGKSTYMRQNALIILMSHIGSFVPATSADICIVDRIFTRIGASDSISDGQSTFMLEMYETSNIIKQATEKSFIILDEIGRGTSTHDGLSIAWAVVEYINNNIKAKTIFSTHYHELLDLETKLYGVVNYSINVKEFGNDVIFLRKIIKGGADKSYGIHVAKLAGMPNTILNSANKISKLIEQDLNFINKNDQLAQTSQMSFFSENPLISEISKIDINNLSPIESLKTLNIIIEKAKEYNNE